jgi:hypothetical protein
MATRDTAQLILEIDAKVATAQRDLNRLARSVQQDAAGMGKSLSDVEASGQRMAKSLGSISNRTRSGFTQLSFQIGDVSQGLAMGTKASTIFAQQSGQVIQALQIMGGEGNKFLRFLGGPWGLAISTAAVVLGSFAGKLFDSGDEVGKLVDKMKEQAKQAALNREADEAWKRTIEGLTEAIRKRREEQEKQLKTDIQAEQASLAGAREELARAQNELTITRARAAAAEKNLANLKNSPTGLTEDDERARAAAIQRAQKRADDLRLQVSTLERAVTDAQRSLRGAQATISERTVEEKLDPVKKATDEYTRTLGDLRDALQAGSISQKQFEDRLESAKKKLDAVKDSAKGAGREFGRQIDFAQASQIARSAGLQVNSAYRSPAAQAALYNNPAVNRPGNPVAPPGASAHNGANGKWAIDIQITDGVTPGKIRKIFADQGVSLSKILKEKGHFHIEGSRSEAAKAENEAQKAAEAATRQQNDFEEQRDSLNQQLIRAQASLVTGIDAQARISEKQIFADEERANTAIHNNLEEGKYGEATSAVAKARAAELLALNHSVAVEKLKSVALERDLAHIRDQDEADQRRFEYKADDLRFADEMATTQAEHRRLQLEILDVVYQQKEAHLRALRAELERARTIENAADIDKQIANIDEQIGRLPTEKAHDTQRTLNGTMNPLEAWAHQVPKTAAEINEALQSIEVRGIESLADALTGVIMGTESLGKAFKNVARSIIADIIQMTIRMLIFKAISGLIGGVGPAPAPSAKGNVFSRGNITPHRRGGVIGSYTVFPMSGGRLGSMAEDGPEAVMPLTRDPSGRLAVRAVGNAANNNQSGPIEVHVVVDASDDLMVKAAVVADQRIRVAEPRIVGRSVNATMRTAGRPTLMGRR